MNNNENDKETNSNEINNSNSSNIDDEQSYHNFLQHIQEYSIGLSSLFGSLSSLISQNSNQSENNNENENEKLEDILSKGLKEYINEISTYFPHKEIQKIQYSNLSYSALTTINDSSIQDNPNLLRIFITIYQFIIKKKKLVKKEIIHSISGYFIEGESTIV